MQVKRPMSEIAHSEYLSIDEGIRLTQWPLYRRGEIRKAFGRGEILGYWTGGEEGKGQIRLRRTSLLAWIEKRQVRSEVVETSPEALKEVTKNFRRRVKSLTAAKDASLDT